MAEPTLALTFNDMCLRVAEYLGIATYGGTGEAAIPTDAHDLDVCSRLVNDGWRKFYNSNPQWNWPSRDYAITFNTVEKTGTVVSATAGTVTPAVAGTVVLDTGRTEANDYFNTAPVWTIVIATGTGAGQWRKITDWDLATRTASVAAWTTAPDSTSTYKIAQDPCVGGEIWRYRMPDGFYGDLLGHFTYGRNTGHLDLIQTNPQQIRSKYAIGYTAGYPTEYAVQPIQGDQIASDARRWELIVWPAPAAALTVYGRIKLYPNKLAGTDLPNCGFQFDEAVMAAIMAEAERQREDNTGMLEGQWAEALVRAIAMDQKTAPTTVGYNADGSDGSGGGGRPYDGVSTYTNMGAGGVNTGTVHTF